MPEIHIKRIPVGAESIDLHHHVNHQEYLRWMQEIAIEHSTGLGWPMMRYLQTGASWYVRSHYIEYLRSAELGDTLLVATWVASMGESSSLRRTLFLRADDRQIVVRAETQWIFVNLKSRRPTAISDEVRQAFTIVASEEAALARLNRQFPPSGDNRPQN